jgi:glycosyltransferase involved in cell wall biosynthesis
MAENYPAMIRDIWTDRRQGHLDVLVRNPAIVALVEAWVIRRVDHILTVVEESSQRLERLGVSPERMTVVSNTPPLERAGRATPRLPNSPLRVIYLGLMEGHRGIGCVLSAAADVKRTGESFHLDMVGDGRDYEQFRESAEILGLTTTDLTFHGRLSHSEALQLVSAAHVGLVPHEARESWNTTIPNKLFDYMAAGLAVITSDAVPAARVVIETGAGLVFRSGDGLHLAEMIRRCRDYASWERFRNAGQQAIRSYYNWEMESQRLAEAISMIEARGANPGR